MATTARVAKGASKASDKTNGSILSFFKKSSVVEPSLFLGEANAIACTAPDIKRDEAIYQATERHLDDEQIASKRRRIHEGDNQSLMVKPEANSMSDEKPANSKMGGPFMDDSDHEEDSNGQVGTYMKTSDATTAVAVSEECRDQPSAIMMPQPAIKTEDLGISPEVEKDIDEQKSTVPANVTLDPIEECPTDVTTHRPALQREATSFGPGDLDDFDDFIDEDFPEDGEEAVERRWMQEQQRMERDFEDDDDPLPIKGMRTPQTPETTAGDDTLLPSCPVCDASLEGTTTEQASIHVNGCLDGKPVPVPAAMGNELAERPSPSTETPVKRFQRAAIARPGQANPFTLGQHKAGSSAFSKIMNSHAEDAAWATAAANELAARGKPAFKRTCPFYKILPGFFICVDAFRYGAVAGCNAYFLSHFHSDHYVGLTSSWCHGPIYCSHVTANLVRQQLRVDPRWVVDLDFEQTIEVPNTHGVHVTMIPANHCPGSSLYLFEKVIGQGPKPRKHRVLHCGDFRACPAHVQHPLLRPDVLDAATGRHRQQKLDVCYLDTTYLTPKYAFPTQDAVISACAQMCMSLSKDRVDESDAWEKIKKIRTGGSMINFMRKDSAPEDKDERSEAGVSESAPSVRPSEGNGRGRLLVIVGTYSIGKERICLGIARALNSKIFAAPGKQRICRALEDPELTSRLTSDPFEAQVHMQMLMEIRAETLADYLAEYKSHFSRIVGFRPSGWNYRPPGSRFVDSPLVPTVLRSENWKPTFSMQELVPQRGSTREAACFGVPYSEHSSFRELTMFCCALHIDKIIPTVNVGSAKSREKMKGWIEKWNQEKKKHGLFPVADVLSGW